jgi:hypothetical protein
MLACAIALATIGTSAQVASDGAQLEASRHREQGARLAAQGRTADA